jgi:hypothetical protein
MSHGDTIEKRYRRRRSTSVPEQSPHGSWTVPARKQHMT